MPWVMTLVSLLIRIDILVPYTMFKRWRQQRRLAWLHLPCVGRNDRQAGFGKHFLAEIFIDALHAHYQRYMQILLWRPQSRLRRYVALHDAAENVHQNGFQTGFFSMILKASVTFSAVAPPPTSRKLAGSPPNNLIVSMVAMARPAPLTRQPMLPSSEM